MSGPVLAHQVVFTHTRTGEYTCNGLWVTSPQISDKFACATSKHFPVNGYRYFVVSTCMHYCINTYLHCVYSLFSSVICFPEVVGP